MKHRVERLARKKNITPEEARKIVDKVDEMRENYVKKYTGTSRYDTRNYQLVITADDKMLTGGQTLCEDVFSENMALFDLLTQTDK